MRNFSERFLLLLCGGVDVCVIMGTKKEEHRCRCSSFEFKGVVPEHIWCVRPLDKVQNFADQLPMQSLRHP